MFGEGPAEEELQSHAAGGWLPVVQYSVSPREARWEPGAGAAGYWRN